MIRHPPISPLFPYTPLSRSPPAYSAVKVGGERAYRRARRGEAVDLAPRPVEVRELELTRFEPPDVGFRRSEEHTSELQSPCNLVCRLLLEKKKKCLLPQCSI